MSEIIGKAQELNATRRAKEERSGSALLEAQEIGRRRAEEFVQLMLTHGIPKEGIYVDVYEPETWKTKLMNERRITTTRINSGWVIKRGNEDIHPGVSVTEDLGVYFVLDKYSRNYDFDKSTHLYLRNVSNPSYYRSGLATGSLGTLTSDYEYGQPMESYPEALSSPTALEYLGMAITKLGIV